MFSWKLNNNETAKALFWCHLLVIVQSCGFIEKRFLWQGAGTPVSFQKVNFAAQVTPASLVEVPAGFFRPLLDENARCFEFEASKHKQFLRSIKEFQNIAEQQNVVLKNTAFLPKELPAYPEEDTLLNATKEFAASGRLPTPRDKVHEIVPESVLLRRAFSDTFKFSSSLTQKWQVEFAKQGVKVTQVQGRSFYARSLEPGNLYQWLVACAKVDLVLPNQSKSSAVWPILMSSEQGTGTKSTTNARSLRAAPGVSLAQDSFAFLYPETLSSSFSRSETLFNIELHARSDAGKYDGLFYWQNDNLYLGRFASVWDEKTVKSYSSLSFQSQLMKSLWRKSSPRKVSEDGSSYFNEECMPVNSSASETFLPQGLHYIDEKTVQSKLDKLVLASDLMPIEVGQAVCKVLFKN